MGEYLWFMCWFYKFVFSTELLQAFNFIVYFKTIWV
jgi:hypothetical protein